MDGGLDQTTPERDRIARFRRCNVGSFAGLAGNRRGWRCVLPRGWVVAVLLLILSTVSTPAKAQPPGRVTEYGVKTAYLYNFVLYFTWPKAAFDGPRAPFIIGVFGDDPLGSALDDMARRKTARGRKIIIRRFRTWADYQACHLLFLPRSAGTANLAEALKRTQRTPLLLVGETPGFATQGATVNFYPDIDGTIGFEVNVDATAERRLRIDARLLKLARVVRNASRPKDGG